MQGLVVVGSEAVICRPHQVQAVDICALCCQELHCLQVPIVGSPAEGRLHHLHHYAV